MGNHDPEATGKRPAPHVGGVWEWRGTEEYKNIRLAYYQNKLIESGVTDKGHLKWLTAQLIQENGQLTEGRIHKNGYVFGIFQYNVRAHSNFKWAKDFHAAHPEWRDWQYQLDYMVELVAKRYELYDGEISCVLVHHFHPYTGKSGKLGAHDLYKRNGHCKTHQYYHSHVAQRLDLLHEVGV